MARPRKNTVLKRRVGKLGGRPPRKQFPSLMLSPHISRTQDTIQTVTAEPPTVLTPGPPEVCRQTIWRRKKRLALQVLQQTKSIIENPGLASAQVLCPATELLDESISTSEVQSAIHEWPRIKIKHQVHLKQRILSSDLKRALKSKRYPLQGQKQVRALQVLEFLRFQRLGLTKATWNMPRMEIAKIVAAASGKSRKTALRIIRNEREWIQTRTMSSGQQGKSRYLHSMLNDEGTQLAVREYLAGAGETVTAHGLALAIGQFWQTGQFPLGGTNTTTMAKTHNQPQMSALASLKSQPILANGVSIQRLKSTLSRRTASSWLHKLGYKYNEVKKGVYKDGHERDDVVEYRQNEFLPALATLEQRLVKWKHEESGKIVMVMPENLPNNVRPAILVTHDESTFDSNDGRSRIWCQQGGAPLRKKSRGKGIMVSDFIFPGGRLHAPSSVPIDALPMLGVNSGSGPVRIDPYFATMKLEYGQNKWWESDDLIKQVIAIAIPIFELQFPGCEAVFLFDNATSHAAYAEDALRVRPMNLRPGGKQPKMRNGFNPLTAMPQQMSDINGEPKGLQIILEERGEWRPGLRIQCRMPGGEKLKKTCLEGGTCCARAIMAAQLDFKAQKCRLQEEVEACNHSILFYPKFHCELNPIEYVWGAAKLYTRNNCGYSISALRKTIPAALNSISAGLILRYWEKVGRMMQAYRQGFSYGTPEFFAQAKRVYKSHRRISEAECS